MISIVIPVFNEEEVLTRLYERVTAAAETWNDDFEVVIVNDGSRDGTAAGLERIHAMDPRWKSISFSRNFGHQAAVSAGLHYAAGDVVVVMDADLQDPPEVVGKMLDKWREGYQVVYAIRTQRKEGILKRFAYSAFYRVLRRVAMIDIPLDSGDFCVMDRAVVNVLRSLPERSRFVRGLRSWAGYRQTGVAYERQARLAGEVKYTFSKLLKLAFDGFFSFSSLPLKASSWLGMGLCALSFLMTVVVLAWWATDVSISGMAPRKAIGWTSLVSLVLLLSGLQMLFIGVIGEYLARMFDEVKGRPPWVIASALGVSVSTGGPAPVGWFAAEVELDADAKERVSVAVPFPTRNAG